MPRVCTICTYAARAEIDAALVQRTPYRRIAALCGVSPDAVRRHKAHIPTTLAQARAAATVADADSLLGKVEALQRKALEILAQAEAERDWRAAIVAIKEVREILELLGRLTGELAKREAPRRGVTLEELVAGAALEAPRGPAEG